MEKANKIKDEQEKKDFFAKEFDDKKYTFKNPTIEHNVKKILDTIENDLKGVRKL